MELRLQCCRTWRGTDTYNVSDRNLDVVIFSSQIYEKHRNASKDFLLYYRFVITESKHFRLKFIRWIAWTEATSNNLRSTSQECWVELSCRRVNRPLPNKEDVSGAPHHDSQRPCDLQACTLVKILPSWDLWVSVLFLGKNWYEHFLPGRWYSDEYNLAVYWVPSLNKLCSFCQPIFFIIFLGCTTVSERGHITFNSLALTTKSIRKWKFSCKLLQITIPAHFHVWDFQIFRNPRNHSTRWLYISLQKNRKSASWVLCYGSLQNGASRLNRSRLFFVFAYCGRGQRITAKGTRRYSIYLQFGPMPPRCLNQQKRPFQQNGAVLKRCLGRYSCSHLVLIMDCHYCLLCTFSQHLQQPYVLFCSIYCKEPMKCCWNSSNLSLLFLTSALHNRQIDPYFSCVPIRDMESNSSDSER